MGARITLQRRLEWMDTDAANMWHHTTVWRLAEWGEAELNRQLGIIDQTFGWVPRRRLEVEFHRPVRFDEEMTVDFRVDAIGRTSVTYGMTVSTDAGEAATVVMIVVLVDAAGQPTPWPDDVAAALRDGTPVP